MVALQVRALSETPLLAVRGLRLAYGTVAALEGIDLAVNAGELFVLLGGSGSGKTTFLRAVAGFARPDAGTIHLRGQSIDTLPPHKRPVNTMFQSYALFPHLTVARNIAFGLRRGELTRSAIRARVADMLDLVRLSGLDARYPHQLSGGQQQRVALARSLAPHPALLLLDEPLSALDPALRAATRAELMRVRAELGTTFILVTHDQTEALTMASRIGVMQQGRLMQVGTPSEIYERPACRFVAEFIGAANVLPARVMRTDGDATLLDIAALGQVRAPASHYDTGAACQLALRPERLRLDAAGENTIAASLTESAYAGDALLHTVRLPDGTMLRVTEPLGRGQRTAPRIGTAVTVAWDADACILLPL